MLAACSGREAEAPQIQATNAPIIIVSIDTLRADRLPAYGYTKVETPHLDAFRRDSILFTNAYSHVPLTLPSHVSMLTGLLPPDHGVRNNIGFRYDAAAHPSITSLLKQRGYATAAAVSAYVLRGNTGLAAAFDHYEDRIVVREGDAAGRLQRRGDETVAAAEQWIAGRGEQPFFLLLHLFEPHSPYEPPEPYRSRYASQYDGEIAATDAILGRFFQSLKSRGIYDRAIIFVTSDHGEGLGDHGEKEHGIFLYREAIQVPLMLKLPAQQLAGRAVEAPVQHIDIVPTIAAMTGVNAPDAAKGVSLLAADIPPRRIYSETHYPRIHLGWSELRSLVDDEFHFIDAPRPELFAASDRAERNNIVDDNRRVVAAMRTALEPFGRDVPQVGNIDPEEAKKLAALGYLSSTSGATGPLPDPKDGIADLAVLEEAAGLDRAGRFGEAIQRLRAVVERNPRLTDAWTMLGRALEKSGRFEEAADTYKRGIQIAPSIAGEFSLSLANVYLMMNRPKDAAAHAEVGLTTNPGSAHVILGGAALANNDFEAALRHAAAAEQSFSYEAPALVLRAQILTKQGNLPQALATIDRAEAAARDAGMVAPALLHYVRGDVLARMNRFPEAIAALEEELRLYPHDRQAYASLAVIYLLTGRDRDAQKTMERLVTTNPGPTSYDLAARTFAELGDEPSAAAWRRRAAQARSAGEAAAAPQNP